MASRSLGSLSLDLLVRMGSFTQGMDKAARLTDTRMKQIEKRAYQAGQVIGRGLTAAAGIATAGFAALTVAVGKAVANADALQDMSAKLAISTEQLSKWGYAARLSGTDLEGLSRGLTLFSKNIAAAADSDSRQANLFETLGISIKDAEGNLRDASSLLPEVADKFKALNNQTTETAVAMQLFGKSGAELLEFLNRGGDGLAALGNELQDLGGVISTDTAVAAENFNDELGRLKETGMGFATQIAAGLLPALTEAAADLRNLVKEGNLAENMVTVLSGALAFGVGAIEAYNTAVRYTSAAMTTLVEAGRGYAEAVTNVWAPWGDGTIAGGIDKARAALGNFNALAAKPAKNPFANVTSSASTGGRTDTGLQNRLNGFLANPSGRSGGGSKGGKSDAEREAEQLAKAYENANERLKEQIALFGLTGEAAKLRYELENGELVKLNSAQKEGLLVQAEQYDAMVKLKELNDQAAEDEKERTQQYDENRKSNQELLAEMQTEIDLLGMSNKERERAIALSYLSADATDNEKAAVVSLSDTYMQARESAEMWADFQSTLADTIFDVASGAKSAEDAIKDFFDSIAKQIMRSIAEGWAEQIANLFKGSGSGGGGGSGGMDWGALIGSFFGGGRAGGGWTSPNKIYEVNERGFEMATVGGRDYMLTGPNAVDITPSHRMGGGMVNNISFHLGAPTELKTQEQIAQRTQFVGKRAMERNR